MLPELPDVLWRAVWIAGSMLFIMSVMDTFAYGVRTAGALAGLLVGWMLCRRQRAKE